MGSSRRSTVWGAIAAVLLVFTVMVVPASHASAVLRPSGCDSFGHFDWASWCKLGVSNSTADKYGDYQVILQRFLRIWGYTPIAIDGNYGPQTGARVREFKLLNGMPNSDPNNFGQKAWGYARFHIYMCKAATPSYPFNQWTLRPGSNTCGAHIQQSLSNGDFWVLRLGGSGFVRATAYGPS